MLIQELTHTSRGVSEPYLHVLPIIKSVAVQGIHRKSGLLSDIYVQYLPASSSTSPEEPYTIAGVGIWEELFANFKTSRELLVSIILLDI